MDLRALIRSLRAEPRKSGTTKDLVRRLTKGLAALDRDRVSAPLTAVRGGGSDDPSTERARGAHGGASEPQSLVSPWRDSPVERAIVESGSHPVSGWWESVLDAVRRGGPGPLPLRIEGEGDDMRWLVDGGGGRGPQSFEARPRTVVVRAGRRGGKSTSALRWMLGEIFEREWRIDPADTGICAIISARRWQALDRIATLRAYLEAYAPGIEVGRPKVDTINLEMPYGKVSVRAFVASKAGVVSCTMIAAILDEVAQWVDDRGTNPATEVISTIKPSLLSTGGSMWLISTPWGESDAHYKAFERGNVPGQRVFYAPTWIASGGFYNKVMTHELESDALIWRREYAALPMAGDSIHWYNSLFINRAIDLGRTVYEKKKAI